MFNLFKKKKTRLDKLNEKFEKLLQEAFMLSKTNRKKSDEKLIKAERMLHCIEKMEHDAMVDF